MNDNLAAIDVVLTPEQLATLDEASRLATEYPGFMLDFQGKARKDQLAAQTR